VVTGEAVATAIQLAMQQWPKNIIRALLPEDRKSRTKIPFVYNILLK
jgi:hypothetical protein